MVCMEMSNSVNSCSKYARRFVLVFISVILTGPFNTLWNYVVVLKMKKRLTAFVISLPMPVLLHEIL